MLPLPTANAITLFCSATLMLAVGIASDNALVVMLAGAVLTGLAGALAWTLPIGARLRAQRLSLSWRHEPGHGTESRGAVLVGVPVRIHASLQHDGGEGLVLRDLSPTLPSHVDWLRSAQLDVVLPGGHRADFTLTLQAHAAGRFVLQGLALTVPGPLDLFRAPLYFPSPLVVRVLPRTAARGTHLGPEHSSLGVERVGRAQRRTRGGGSDLHELRELVPGDPFKSIAWKASARTGRLMVREVEAEVQTTLYVVLDVSGTMRGGAVGARKLDHALEVATLAARTALERGDRVGLVTADGRVVGHTPARDGVAHLPALQETLLAALETVDQDLTEPDDDEVAQLVARYVRAQDGISFAIDGAREREALTRHVSTQLALDREARDRAMDVVADTANGRVLRAFCRVRGLGLRYRAETRGMAKAAGLAKALTEAAGKSREPRSLLLITDFDGMGSPEPLLKVLRLLRTQGHDVRCVLPDARSALGAVGTPLGEDLAFVYGLGEARRTREARTMLGRLGIPLIVSERRGTDAAA
jgi:uncharacterized protein (DUF58 family)